MDPSDLDQVNFSLADLLLNKVIYDYYYYLKCVTQHVSSLCVHTRELQDEL